MAKTAKKFVFGYVTTTSLVVLNCVIFAADRCAAIDELNEGDRIAIVLSCVEVDD